MTAPTPPKPLTRVAIAGATGYAGQELVRILARHPRVTLTAAMSSGATSTPRAAAGAGAHLGRRGQPLDVERLVSEADVIFLALPEAASAELAPTLLERGARVIDLSGAFRIRNASDRRRWYPATASLPEGPSTGSRKVTRPRSGAHGSCPIRAAIPPRRCSRSSRSIARVCSTARWSSTRSRASPALARRRRSARISPRTTAASRPTRVFQHRHTAEIEQELGATVTFVPHLVPLDRGILETIYGRSVPGTTEQQVADALTAAYADAPFVRLTGGALPEIKHVAHTNFCDIGWKVDQERNRIVLVAVIDNLLKGAAGSAVQNLNVMLGLDERTGLL